MEFITNTGETVEVEYTYDPGEPQDYSILYLSEWHSSKYNML